MGKGKGPQTSAEDARSHNSAPLSTLRDPSSFGPPPSHVNKAEPRAYTRATPAQAPAKISTANFPESQVLATAPQGDGWGSPLPSISLEAQQQEQREAEEAEAAAEAAPAVPYRANTTGLSTAGMPAPPVKRLPAEEIAPQQPPKTASRPVPPPPPRLPPRQNSNPDEYSQPPPPPYTTGTQSSAAAAPEKSPGYLNPGAVNRLGQAGVSVPDFEIGGGRQAIHNLDAASEGARQPVAPSSNGQMSELQARFRRMPGRVSSPTAQSPQQEGSSSGTSWQQKQAALSTASKFQKDPVSVTMSDAKEAGSTANNFRQRHGEQIAQGWQQAQGLDKKYGVSNRAGGVAQGAQQEPIPSLAPATAPSPIEDTAASSTPSAGTVVGKKAPPPPPPKKKPELSAGSGTTDTPPVIPTSSKPRF